MSEIARSKLTNKLDNIFSRCIRITYSDEEWYCECYTCWKRMRWNDRNCTCWHWIPRSVQFLRWYKNNARPQCWRCNNKNIWNWEPVLFEIHLEKEVWAEEVKRMKDNFAEYKKDVLKYKVRTYEIEEMLEEYKKKLKEEADKRWIKL